MLLRNKFEIQFKCFFREKKFPSLDGFEPSTFRLTAERANQLRHRDCSITMQLYFVIYLKQISKSYKKFKIVIVKCS